MCERQVERTPLAITDNAVWKKDVYDTADDRRSPSQQALNKSTRISGEMIWNNA